MSKAQTPVDPAALCGDLIEEYTAKGGATCGVYCGTLDGDEARRGFLTRVQSSMRWYIENYSAIDLDDERWRFFAVFEKPADGSSGGHRLVAAATIFRFTRFASGGLQTLLRICQVLVMPPYRAQGHGKQLLQAVYAHARREGAVQVTVEDPNPQFRFVRDLTDARNCVDKKLLAPPSFSEPPTEQQLEQARTELLLTDEQIWRCYELQQFDLLQRSGGGGDGDGGKGKAPAADVEKPFRLAVKRRLNKRHQEELDGVAMQAAQPDGAPVQAEAQDEAEAARAKAVGVEARKRRLEELYQETITEYQALAKRLK